jgi:hypothetical protein
VVQDLARQDPSLTVNVQALVEADWAVHLQNKVQELKGSARLVEHSVAQPLAIHSAEGYLGPLPAFLQWARTTYKYEHRREAATIAAEAKAQFSQYVRQSANVFVFFDFTVGGKPAAERVIFEVLHFAIPSTRFVPGPPLFCSSTPKFVCSSEFSSSSSSFLLCYHSCTAVCVLVRWRTSVRCAQVSISRRLPVCRLCTIRTALSIAWFATPLSRAAISSKGRAMPGTAFMDRTSPMKALPLSNTTQPECW